MTATMQIVATSTLPIERQIRAKKEEIKGYGKLIRLRDKWLQEIENRSKSNYRDVVQSRDYLKQKLTEAKYELYKLEQ